MNANEPVGSRMERQIRPQLLKGMEAFVSILLMCGVSVCLALASNPAWGAEPASPRDLPPNTPEAANPLAAQVPEVPQQPQPAASPGISKSPDRPEKGAPAAVPEQAKRELLPPPMEDIVAVVTTTPPRSTPRTRERITHERVLGDQGTLGIPATAFGPAFGAIRGAALVPSVRGFKIADDESPQPQDRVYVDFNYYDRLNEAVNRRFGADLHEIRIYRETFGVEKTLLDGDASIGLRLPLNTLSADSGIPGLGSTSTDVGDLSLIFKGTLWENRETGSLFSAGLAVTVPTGPNGFAGASFSTSFHETTLQPFVGYIRDWPNFYLQGFTAIDIPTDSSDVTILYNDVSIGYYLYRNREWGRLLTAVVPTFEVHVNTPLN
jgi:hypothetical protein